MAPKYRGLTTGYTRSIKISRVPTSQWPIWARLPPHLWVSKYVSICTQYVCDILTTHWTLCSPLVLLTIQCMWANFCAVHVSCGGVYKNFTTLQGGGGALVRLATEIVHLGQSPTCAPPACCLYLLPPPPDHGSNLNTCTERATCSCHAGPGWRANRVLRLSRELGTLVANSNDPFRYWVMCFEEIRKCIIEAYNRTMTRPNREE